VVVLDRPIPSVELEPPPRLRLSAQPPLLARRGDCWDLPGTSFSIRPHAVFPDAMKLAFALLLLSQNITQRGFIESRATFYPQTTINDSANFVGEMLLRDEVFYKPHRDFQFSGGIDLRTDTHHQVERDFHFSTFYFLERELRRPLFSIRRLSAEYHRGGFNIEAGKQFVRWGRADILNPTDRFAPRDLLTIVDPEFLGITAIRATYERGANTLDAVWAPRFTPSRIPLVGQRWLPIPAGVVLAPMQSQFPNGTQAGLRWSHVGLVEFSGAYYQGFSDIPAPDLSYTKLRMVGGDAAVPLRWLTIKTEAGYFDFSSDRNDDYVLYVIQLERQSGEWFFVGGYAGEILTERGTQLVNFNPDRGISKSILGRAGYTIDANRSIAVETAVHQNGDGFWSKFEYSQAYGQHWRLTGTLSLFRGDPLDFLGQYRRNSNGLIAVKYSF